MAAPLCGPEARRACTILEPKLIKRPMEWPQSKTWQITKAKIDFAGECARSKPGSCFPTLSVPQAMLSLNKHSSQPAFANVTHLRIHFTHTLTSQLLPKRQAE